MNNSQESYSSGKVENTRVKVKPRKKVGITLTQNLVEKARKRNLNISRITEQALFSILDYLKTQHNEKSSRFLNESSFLKESSVAPRARLEPATNRNILRLFPQNPIFMCVFFPHGKWLLGQLILQ